MWDMANPVGTIRQFYSGFDPNDVRGEWSKIEGCFLLASGGGYERGSTGGEAEHRLSVHEMPSHSHSGVWAYYAGTQYGWLNTSSGSSIQYNIFNTGAEGGGQPHNNMPPYLAVDTWRRVA